jgi:hypothetical protein
MRYSVTCRYINDGQGGFLYQKPFKNLGDAIAWLNSMYREGGDTHQFSFEWTVYDHETEAFYSNTIRCFKGQSLIDLMFDYDEFSRYLKIKNVHNKELKSESN